MIEQQFLCRTVHQQDLACRVDRDDPGGDRFEHSFDKGAPFVELLVGPHQGLSLAFKLRRHAVEGTVQQTDLIRAGTPLHPEREIAAPDLPRCRHQIIERLHLPIGKTQAEPDRETNQPQ